MSGPSPAGNTPAHLLAFGIRLRVYGISYFLGKWKAERHPHSLAAAEFHARTLRDYSARRLAEAERARDGRLDHA